MRAIVDTATDGVVLIAPDGSIRSISRAAEALFGFDNDDVTGKPFASLFAIESQRAARTISPAFPNMASPACSTTGARSSGARRKAVSSRCS